MAFEIVGIKFNGTAPTPQDVVVEAERLGGLKINIVESKDRGLVVAFFSFPDGLVTIDSLQQSHISIMDYSCVAPALYRLLWQTSVLLGGDANNPEMPLTLPLTETYVSEFGRKYRNLGLTFLLYLLAMFAAVVCGIAWLAWRYVLA